MSIKQTWAIATEKRLVHEAGCMGELLEQFRGRISPALIGERAWERLLERVRKLPVTIAAFPFGFEVPLHERRPVAQFGVSMLGGTRTAELFKEIERSSSADATTAGVVRFLDETDREESPLRRIAGRKIALAYDIDSTPVGEASAPGLFLYPIGETLAGGSDSRRLKDMGVILDALELTTDRNADSEERCQVERVYRALDPDTRLSAAGTYPSRPGMVHLVLEDFRKRHAVMEFLDRVNWPGQYSTVDSILLPFAESGAFGHLSIHLDVDAAGVGPTLSLGLHGPKGRWVKGGRQWTAIVDALRQANITVPEKLLAVLDWAAGSEPFTGKSGPFVMVRGIHHFTITLNGDQVGPVKSYLFLLLFSWPLELSSDE